MIIQYSNGTCQRCISCTFAHTVDSKMQAVRACFHAFKYIGGAQVIIVVRMKIEMLPGISLHDLCYKTANLRGSQYAKCVGQHNPFYGLRLQKVEVLEHIIF